ncbi:MAG: hypothetical protein WCH62_01275 [Candidatus Omnitrophota bacterium]
MVIGSSYSRLRKWSEKVGTLRQKEMQQVGVQEDVFGLEEVIYFEKAMQFCYQSLAMGAHNRMFRQRCQDFFKRSLTHERDLKEFLKGNIPNQQSFVDTYYQGFSLPTIEGAVEPILDLGLAVAWYRLHLYQDLRGYAQIKKRILFNLLIAHAKDEISFLENEIEISKMERLRV